MKTDFIGRKFGLLTVESFGGRSAGGHFKWACVCECGGRCTPFASNLLRGLSSSCGCVIIAKRPFNTRTHGLSHTREYNIWIKIRDRCGNPDNAGYKNYGGRRITVCQRWQDSFDDFLSDMGKSPSTKHSIERHDNYLGYNPDNCAWELPKTQANNRRTNKMVIFRGSLCTLAQAIDLGSVVSYQTAWARIKAGCPADIALTTPSRQGASL